MGKIQTMKAHGKMVVSHRILRIDTNKGATIRIHSRNSMANTGFVIGS
jgi:hypothetical protein